LLSSSTERRATWEKKSTEKSMWEHRVGITPSNELNPDYLKIAEKRLGSEVTT
jgi:hypothetical protein